VRLAKVSIAVVLTLGLDVSASVASASVAEQVEPARQANLIQTQVFGLDSRQEPGNFTFRIEEWLDENGSGGFGADFTDEKRRGTSWEEPPQ
jgi:hypothetical protein